ncbi:MAG: hypothetical protein SFV51_28130 [Bryobacteraceae bacterium]|nr:hypothetical protein [Bryobacteraceae bacterium]
MEQASKLDRISPGISVQEALHWLCEGCLPGWSLLTAQQQLAHIRELRTLLSDPLTAEQAEALREIGGGRQSIEEVVDWLRHAPMGRREHRRMLMRRIVSGLGTMEGLPRQGYVLDFGAREGFKHEFCGPHSIQGGLCPNCHKPLLRLLSLDTRDERLRLGRVGFPYLHLMYCWTCAIPSDYFIYRMSPAGGLDLHYYGRGAGREPYAGYPPHFPGRRVSLRALSRRQQTVMRVFNTPSILAPTAEEELLIEPLHQIGGEPHLIAPLNDVLCQKCGHKMPMLASVCDNAGGAGVRPGYAESFTQNAEVQVMFHYCRRCWVVGAYHIRGWDGFAVDVVAPAPHVC